MREPCRKKRFAHILDARRELLKCWKKRRNERRVYWCNGCKAYHLTSQDGAVPKDSPIEGGQ